MTEPDTTSSDASRGSAKRGGRILNARALAAILLATNIATLAGVAAGLSTFGTRVDHYYSEEQGALSSNASFVRVKESVNVQGLAWIDGGSTGSMVMNFERCEGFEKPSDTLIKWAGEREQLTIVFDHCEIDNAVLIQWRKLVPAKKVFINAFLYDDESEEQATLAALHNLFEVRQRRSSAIGASYVRYDGPSIRRVFDNK